MTLYNIEITNTDTGDTIHRRYDWDSDSLSNHEQIGEQVEDMVETLTKTIDITPDEMKVTEPEDYPDAVDTNEPI